MKILEYVKRKVSNAVMKGAALEDYLLAAVFFVVIGVTVSIGAYITAQVQTNIGIAANSCVNTVGNAISQTTGLCYNTANTAAAPSATNLAVAYNAGGQAVSGMNTFATWLPILAIVLVSVVIIALLYGFLVGGGRGGYGSPTGKGKPMA